MRACERLLIGAALLLSALFAPSAAVAAVHVNPNTPAGTEYAIPLAEARDQGSTGTEQAGGASTASGAQLFGAGIRPAHSTHPGDRRRNDARSTRRRHAAETPAASPAGGGSGGPGGPAILAINAADRQSGDRLMSSFGVELLAVAALLLAVLGLLLVGRRRSARRTVGRPAAKQ
jgi:hypothetical protein